MEGESNLRYSFLENNLDKCLSSLSLSRKANNARMKLNNWTKRIIISSLILIYVSGLLFAHGAGVHSQQLCYVLFGYQSSAELNTKTNSQTTRAYELIRRAIAVAIDETNKGGKHSDDYNYLRRNLAGQVRIPTPSAFSITNRFHRQVCHQGFDYKYNNKASQARWQTGRQLLIDVVAKTFGNPRTLNPAVSDFIAMISYYTHLIGDLEEGETYSMKGTNSTVNIGTYSGMLSELITKIKVYGERLPNSALIDDLIEELGKLRPKMPTNSPTTLGEERTKYSTDIFNVLSEYVPKIISNNVDAGFIFNTNPAPLLQAA